MFVKSLDKLSELVCGIRGYEQLLNCCFQITTFICLLVFFIFVFFVVFLPVFLITITNLRKVYQKSNIFFLFIIFNVFLNMIRYKNNDYNCNNQLKFHFKIKHTNILPQIKYLILLLHNFGHEINKRYHL
jgi:hypothetical protein